MRQQPGGGRLGQRVEGGTEGLPHQLQAVQGADRRQDVGGIGALSSPFLEEMAVPEPLQEGLEEEQFGGGGQQAGAELAQQG
jgi:hypothetical protein